MAINVITKHNLLPDSVNIYYGFFQPSCSTFSQHNLHINEEDINSRILELDGLVSSTKYSKQKESLRNELSNFLECLNTGKTIENALPSDIRKFIVFKDASGKTQVHKPTCRYRGQHGNYDCGCPLRRSAGSIDSLIGQIRAILHDIGRGTEWSDVLGVGNPAATPII